MRPSDDNPIGREAAEEIVTDLTPAPPAAVPPSGRSGNTLRDGEPVPEVAAPLAPSERYRVEDEIGRGGMGTVVRAFDSVLRRSVAIKTMHAARADAPEVHDRFLDEAQATAQLEHPGIVPVYDMGRDAAGRLFFTMKLVRGRTLAAVLAARELSVFRLLETFVEVARAVAYAHERGVVHRDLKPGNIMLGAHGEVHVVDWGIAKVLGRVERGWLPPQEGSGSPGGAVSREETTGLVATDSGRDATAAGAVVGTPAFMAPEQARGDVAAVGPRTDVYALGAVLFAIVAGQSPYSGDAKAIVDRVASRDPSPRAREVAARVARELDAICARAMAKAQRDRYASARALADDVQAYLEGLPVSAHPERLLGRVVKWARRHRGVTATIAAGVVVALLGSLVALVRIDRARRVAEFRLERVDHEKAVAALARGDAREASALLAAALTLADTRETREGIVAARARACRLLLRASERDEPMCVAVSPDGASIAEGRKGGAVLVRDAASGRERVRLAGHTDQVWRVAWNPDGRSLATASYDGTGRIFEVPPLEAGARRPPSVVAVEGRAVVTGAGHLAACAWSPDGARVAFGSADRLIRIHDARSGAEVAVLRGHQEGIAGLAFSPDGRRLASAGCDLTARVWDLESGREVLRLEEHETWVYAVAWSPDGALLATASDAVRLWDPATGRRLDTIRPDEAAVRDLAFSADGRLLATSSIETGLHVIDVEARRAVLAIGGHGPASTTIGVAFTPDGRRLVSAGLERALHVFELPPQAAASVGAGAPGGARLAVAIGGQRREIWAVRFSPDGRRVVASSAEDTARVLDVASGRAVAALREPGVRILDVDVSADGGLVATACVDGRARVYDAASGALVSTCEAGPEYLTAVRFRPGRSQLLTAGGADGAARLFDAASGAPVTAIPHEAGINTLAPSPDGRLLATASGARVRIWRLETGALARELPPHEGEVDALAWSADGARLATTSWGRRVRTWDVETGAALLELPQQDDVYAVAFRPDGRRLAVACEDQAARVLDASSGALLYTLRGHGGNVVGLAWSPDGARLATGGSDRRVRVWDLAEVERVLSAPAAALLDEARRETGLEVDGLDVRPAGLGR